MTDQIDQDAIEREWNAWDEEETGGGLPAPARMAVAGVAGAAAVNLLNEGARRLFPHTPRMEVIGERALTGTLSAVGVDAPRGSELYRVSLAADLASNTAYYSLVGVGDPKGAWLRGAGLGLAAGLGAWLLPKPFGLGSQPGERKPLTQILTVLWYTLAGLTAAAAVRATSSSAAGDTA